MFDRYTKIVLTVIAVALSAIAIEGSVGSAHAQMESCGSTSISPCFVDNVSQLGLPVHVMNWPYQPIR